MFIVAGKRNAKIKTFNDYQHSCGNCKAFDIEVKVYEDYFHAFFIPVFPIDNKSVKMHCNACGNPFRLFVLEKEYEKTTKAPFYFYTLSMLFLCLVLVIAIAIVTS